MAEHTSREYVHAELKRLLAEDTGIAELGIEVIDRGGLFVLRGHVESPDRRAAVERCVCERIERSRVVNEIRVIGADPPQRAEELP